MSKNVYRSESLEGSEYWGYLVVHDSTGREMRVPVPFDVYRQAEPGMMVRRAEPGKQVEIVEPR